MTAVTANSQETEWFEVFFDLIFAVAVTFWAERVARDPSARTYLAALGWLIPIFWLWLGHTIYAMRFGESVPLEQAAALTHILGAGLMSLALTVEHVSFREFAVGYLLGRVGLFVLYALGGRRKPSARSIANYYLAGFGCGASFWAASLFLSERAMPWLWGAGLTIDFAVPWLRRPLLTHVPLDHRRLASRIGTFVSLLLAISVEGIVRGRVDQSWDASSFVVAGLSFAIIVCLWWLYAARINRSSLADTLGSGQPYLYSHLPIVIGAGTVGVGIRVLQGKSSSVEAAEGLALVATGVLLWIVGMVLVRRVVLKHRDRHWYGPFVGAAIGLPLVALWGEKNPSVALGAVAGLLAILAVVELRHGQAHAAGLHHL